MTLLLTLGEGNMSPTALIPFCDLGGNLSATGVKIDQFDVPVCNCFKEKIVEDQLCYEVDPNLYINKENTDNAKEFDLMIVVDYNEDRQLYLYDEASKVQLRGPFRSDKLKTVDFLYLETIGTNVNNKNLIHNAN